MASRLALKADGSRISSSGAAFLVGLEFSLAAFAAAFSFFNLAAFSALSLFFFAFFDSPSGPPPAVAAGASCGVCGALDSSVVMVLLSTFAGVEVGVGVVFGGGGASLFTSAVGAFGFAFFGAVALAGITFF